MNEHTPDCDATDPTDELEELLVEYDEDGRVFGTSGAGAYFLAQFLADRGVRVIPPAEDAE